MPEQNQQSSYGGQSQTPVSRREHFSSRSFQGTPVRLLIFSLCLFLFANLIWAGLSYGYGGFLDRQIKDVEGQIRLLTEKIAPEEQRELSLFYTRLASIDSLLKKRKISGKVFDFLEETLHPRIYYTRASYSATNGTVEAAAVAGSLRDVVEQLSILNNEENLSLVMVNNIQRDGQSISFSLSLEFNNLFFVRSF